MKKCPHCGMNIRDDVEVCGYCGGEIPKDAPARSAAGRSSSAPQRNVPQRQAPKREQEKPAAEPGSEEEEEEDGGLSRVLQPGEQILIGSLNVSVKKFAFHAYLTNQRIFLIDSQEKKIRVTAKDVPRNTIADSSVEYSESSDPVLVLSVKSVDDEDVKTMKLVFTQDGTDRSAEVDDWISMLHEEAGGKKQRRAAAPPAREQPAEEPLIEEIRDEEPVAAPPARPAKPAARHEELRPAHKPLKEHERQPPVKRLMPIVREPEPEEPEPEIRPQHRRVQVRAVGEQQQPVRSDTLLIRKPEVQTAVRSAMKSPVQPMRQTTIRPIRSPTPEPVRRPVPEPEPVPEVTPVEMPTIRRQVVHEEPAENPQFCFNCGKKLPAEANFCPGCGTKLGRAKAETTAARHAKTLPRMPAPAAAATTAPHLKKLPRIEEVRDEDEEEEPPRRPPVKRTPKGSDMTILQKFLRR